MVTIIATVIISLFVGAIIGFSVCCIASAGRISQYESEIRKLKFLDVKENIVEV